MGLFYIWLKNMPGESVSQELIAFVNREAADEWWRSISTPPSVHAGHVERMSPQLYVHISGGNLFYDFKTTINRPRDNVCYPDDGVLLEPYSRTTISPSRINNFIIKPSTIIPGNEITDHISGRWYFLRSKADPSSHWYLRTSGTCAVCAGPNCDAIHVSSDYRTRFCIRVRDPAAPENFVMIRKDEISIAAPRGYSLFIDDAGDLKAKKDDQGESDLLFGDLSNRFIARAERQVNGEVWEYVESVERDVGEPWELA